MDRVVIFYARLRANDPKAILAYRRLKGLAPTDPRCAAILAKLRRLAAASMAQMSTGAEPAHLRAPLQGHLLTAARPTVRPRVWRPEGRPGFRPGPGRPGGFHPGLRPAFAGPHAVLHGLRPGGYRASWAYGRNRFFHPGTGWTSGWFGWRRPGWRGWGWHAGSGWVWGYPGTLVIDASDPTQILAPQADGSAQPVDASQLPPDASQTPDPSSAPPPDGSTDDGTPDSDDDEEIDHEFHRESRIKAQQLRPQRATKPGQSGADGEGDGEDEIDIDPQATRHRRQRRQRRQRF